MHACTCMQSVAISGGGFQQGSQGSCQGRCTGQGSQKEGSCPGTAFGAGAAQGVSRCSNTCFQATATANFPSLLPNIRPLDICNKWPTAGISHMYPSTTLVVHLCAASNASQNRCSSAMWSRSHIALRAVSCLCDQQAAQLCSQVQPRLNAHAGGE